MTNKTFEEKIALIRKVRLGNYKESLRLEGRIPSDVPENTTKEEIIKKYLGR